MTPTTLDRPAPAEAERFIDRGLDALRQVSHQASHLSHEARLLKSAATEAIDDGVHTVKRTAKTLRQDALDLRDDVTYRVKREPMKAMAIVFAAGTLAGFLLAVLRPKRTNGHDGCDMEC